jgi:hypothetical protein
MDRVTEIDEATAKLLLGRFEFDETYLNPWETGGSREVIEVPNVRESLYLHAAWRTP